MTEEVTNIIYSGPALGETVNGRVINATRATAAGNFVSHDGGATYFPVDGTGVVDEAKPETAAETIPAKDAPAEDAPAA